MKRPLWCLTLVLIASFTVIETSLGADESESDPNAQRSSVEIRLEEIANQIQSESEKLDQLQKKQRELNAELLNLQKTVGEIRASIVKTEGKLSDLETKRSDVEIEAAETDQRLLALGSLTRERVRALAMQSNSVILERLVLTKSPVSFTHLVYYLEKVRDRDARLSRELQGLFAEKRDQVVVLKGLIDQQRVTQAEFTKQKSQLDERVSKLDRVKSGIATEKKKIEQGLKVLRAESLRFETVMVSLTGGEDDSSSQPSLAERVVVSPEKTLEFAGQGLSKKGYRAPVEGKVIRRFGTAPQGALGFVLSKGVEVSAPAGSQVRAIERSKVIFDGTMPEYGHIVILDHGVRQYSLYGRLGKSSTAVGDILEKDVTFALVSEAGGGSSNFYFEVRKDGKPVAPSQYVKGY